eukprot:163703-Amphidinium_carterae.2
MPWATTVFAQVASVSTFYDFVTSIEPSIGDCCGSPIPGAKTKVALVKYAPYLNGLEHPLFCAASHSGTVMQHS